MIEPHDKEWSENKCPVPFLQSTLRAASREKVPDTYFPLIAEVGWGVENECGVETVDVDSLVNIGWREWVGLPDLSIRSIKAKIDTGARSSCLHAFDIEPFVRDGQPWVRFDVHPIQRNDRLVKRCEAPVFDRRHVRSSNGLTSERFVIQTTLMVVGQLVPIELTLANRDAMGFRMLIGREAMRGRFLVDSGRSYFGGRPVRKAKRKP